MRTLLTILFCLMMLFGGIILLFENERFWEWLIYSFPDSFKRYEIDRNEIHPAINSFSDSGLSFIIGIGKKFGKFENISIDTRVENDSENNWGFYKRSKFFFTGRNRKKAETIHHKEILKVLLGLDDEKLNELLKLYKQEFGTSAARYARKTYRKWENGEVKPIKQTFERFMVHLPKVMDFDMKTEVLRHLMEEYCARDKHSLTVYTDDWEKSLEPLVKQVIEKPYNSRLPKQIEDRLKWLAYDDMDVARQLLAESKVQEGKIAVSMLQDEFENIEYLLANTKGKGKVTHKLKFPYGTINLDIKRR